MTLVQLLLVKRYQIGDTLIAIGVHIHGEKFDWFNQAQFLRKLQ